jgi:mannose-6-phosphate isomerase-like protein (cupin superfamily)
VSGDDEVAVRVSAEATGGDVLALDVTMGPGGGPPALHRHAAVETYRVLEGELTFYLGAGERIERFEVHAGAVVHIPGGREHTIRNESAAPAHGYVTFTDGAEQMERFARAAAALAARARPAPEDVLALAQRHGVHITRPLPGQTSSAS